MPSSASGDGTSGSDPSEYQSNGFTDENFLWLRHPGSPKTDNRGYPKHIQVTNATSGPLNLDDRDFRFAGKSRLLEVNSVDDIEVVIRCVQPLSAISFEESANTDIRVTRLIAIAFG